MPRRPSIEDRLVRDASLEIQQANQEALRLDALIPTAPPAQREHLAAQMEAAHDRLKAAEAIMKKVAKDK